MIRALLACLQMVSAPALADTARGVVYVDGNRDGVRQAGEAGLEGVLVSNGRDVVATDEVGRYEIDVADGQAVFVIKPRDHALPLDAHNKPRFYHVHRPNGSPRGLRFPGLSPTGPLPASLDFALHASPEPDRFSVVLVGDPQPRNLAELEYFAHDIVGDIRGTGFAQDAAFVLSLGDLMFDNLSLFEPYNEYMSVLGAPVHNVLGNHDINFDVADDEHSAEAWRRVYGPPDYAFRVGRAWFFVLDNVVYEGEQNDKKYHADLRDDQLEFVRNVLAHADRDALVVLAMHIPLPGVRRKAELFEILSPFAHTFSVSAHWHRQRHYFIGPGDGWLRAEPHHHLVHATGSGSWWAGVPDERGIPHATMSDGQPNGWSLLTIDGNRYDLRFKAAGRPEAEHMAIYLPSVLDREALAQTTLKVNAYSSSVRSTMEYRIGDGPWRPMAHAPQHDPAYLAMKALEEQFPQMPGRRLPEPSMSESLWEAPMPTGLTPGPYRVEVRHTDVFGRVWTGERVLRVR